MRITLIFICCLLSISLNAQRIIVPLGGNSFLTAGGSAGEKLDSSGWMNWGDPVSQWSVFVWIGRPGTVRANWVINLPEGNYSSIRCRINDMNETFQCNSEMDAYSSSYAKITTPGYLRIDMQGLSKSGKWFGQVSSLVLEGSAIDSSAAFVKSNEGNYFYWGRRGPSVHINYDLSEIKEDIEWFYNEITVPEGNDVIGSYFMANGFGEGYFGMQVNSAKERRMLFSVWSPFNTDDPKAIPEDKKIRLLAKGDKVHTGEFGNEGSGGQSYLVYPWKAGLSYCFLLRGQPMDGNKTRYTAWFKEKSSEKWNLMASFERPATTTWLKRLHSFLENFIPETGHITRMAWYHDQWVCSNKGNWIPLSRMQFTADATARKGYRLDYQGGTGLQGFYLKNDGFFNEKTAFRTVFEWKGHNKPPVIDTTGIMPR